MTPLFKKLNYKNQIAIHVLNAPTSFDEELEKMKEFTQVKTSCSTSNFILVFVTKEQEVANYAKQVKNFLETDGVVWFCYPKQSSKKYKCEFNRDNGWNSLGVLGYEPVRMVAIDEDWSALRFRKTEHIKKITRRESFALTTEAKQRTTQKGK
jgi:hypothetical protein